MINYKIIIKYLSLFRIYISSTFICIVYLIGPLLIFEPYSLLYTRNIIYCSLIETLGYQSNQMKLFYVILSFSAFFIIGQGFCSIILTLYDLDHFQNSYNYKSTTYINSN